VGGFTLVELLVTITIIGLLAALFLGGLYSVEESSKVQKTKGTIAKINNIIMARWESYRTRRVPIQFSSTASGSYTGTASTGISPITAAGWRLDALHELQRMELPDHWTDFTTVPEVAQISTASRPALSTPSLALAYSRKYTAISPSATYENAECLYMICMTGVGDEVDPRELFKAAEIGDKDHDGAPEFWDAWQNPIIFIRWAPGFTSELQSHLDPDPFDPRHVYPSVTGSTASTYPPASLTYHSTPTFALYPLVVSAGPDGSFNLFVSGAVYGTPNADNDPFYSVTTGSPDGSLTSTSSADHIDNITNHLMGTK
jgi:prepilin-type N-terminal cleavage/methylation domain-containing protein